MRLRNISTTAGNITTPTTHLVKDFLSVEFCIILHPPFLKGLSLSSFVTRVSCVRSVIPGKNLCGFLAQEGPLHSLEEEDDEKSVSKCLTIFMANAIVAPVIDRGSSPMSLGA